MSEVKKLLEQLISKESISPNDNGCQDLVAEKLREAGFHLRWINRGETTNLWAAHGEGDPTFCFAGHTDVVPPGPLEDWISDPFVATDHHGFLTGRGAADMKAGVAAMVVAAIRLAVQGHKGRVAILLTSDEETSGIDGTAYALQTLIDSGEKIGFALVGEPTSEEQFGDVIKIGRRGSLNGKLTITGKQGHTAYPQLADNAAHHLIRIMNGVAALDWSEAEQHFPGTTLQISDIKAGSGATNVIPGTAECRFNVRFSTAWSEEEIRGRIEDLASRSGAGYAFEWSASAQPFRTRSEDLITALTEAIRTETGITPDATTGGGTSDARCFAAHNIPVVEFGPINKTIHASNESVAIACLEPLARIYQAFATAMLGG